MKSLIVFLSLIFLFSYQAFTQTEFELTPEQSMLMTGKGPGQDGTINPYDGEDCYAIVDNIGELEFSIRILNKKDIIEIVSIKKGESKKLTLLKGYQLYLDPNENGIAKARVDYMKME